MSSTLLLPHAHSFVKGPAVINTHTVQIFRICRHGKVPYRRFNSPEASAHVQVQRKYGWELSNRVCRARGAAAHACAPGLSTGRRLMPMPARCGAAAPCRGAATVRRSPHTRRVLRRVLLGRGCLCGAHRARATAATTKRLHACACEGADENSWQSRPRHACALQLLGQGCCSEPCGDLLTELLSPGGRKRLTLRMLDKVSETAAGLSA